MIEPFILMINDLFSLGSVIKDILIKYLLDEKFYKNKNRPAAAAARGESTGFVAT